MLDRVDETSIRASIHSTIPRTDRTGASQTLFLDVHILWQDGVGFFRGDGGDRISRAEKERSLDPNWLSPKR